jgi:phage N-6-adenine-methyltransferase
MTSFFSSNVAFSSKDDTWTTPKSFFVKVAQEFDFTLDAAALKSSALCQNWFGPDHEDTTKQDAFLLDWHTHAGGGTIWLNPPYGRTIGQWVAKAHSEALKGATVVCLVPARTDTAWFQDYCLPHEVRFIRGRLKFGSATNSAPFPSALVIMRKIETQEGLFE